MGHLKWEPEEVHKGMDELEVLVQTRLRPVEKALARAIRRVRKEKNLPGYVTQRLDVLAANTRELVSREFASIANVRSQIPGERTNGRGWNPSLVEGQTYRICVGGAYLNIQEVVQYGSYSHTYEHRTQLHVGDIVTYLGNKSVVEGQAAHDIFQIESFDVAKGATKLVSGPFFPEKKPGQCNRSFLEAV